MSRARAAAGTATFLFLAPGVVAGVIPWLLTGWEVDMALWMPLRIAGGVILAISIGVLLHAFARFVVEGVGTPAPVAPTERLVVGGLYRYVRNPMYLAVVGAIAGQALLLGQVELLIYAGVMQLIFVAFVHWYEEPTLRKQFGNDYDDYRQAVPAWIPRRSTRRR
jgi:protein-S-isoprenylcysteine O-methyltransferase Ste14